MKKLILPAIAAAMLILFFVSSALAIPEIVLTIKTDVGRVSPGGTVSVTVTAESTVPDIAAWEARVYYDPAIFKYDSCELSYGIFCDPTVQSDENGTYVTLSLIDKTGKMSISAGSLGSIRFAANGAEGTSARFGVTQTAYYDARGERTTRTQLRWTYSVAVRSIVVVEPGDIPGDANNDKVVDRYDAALILRWTAGLIGDDEIDLLMADVDGGGSTNVVDTVWVLRFIDGSITAFQAYPSADGQSEDPPEETSDTADRVEPTASVETAVPEEDAVVEIDTVEPASDAGLETDSDENTLQLFPEELDEAVSTEEDPEDFGAENDVSEPTDSELYH